MHFYDYNGSVPCTNIDFPLYFHLYCLFNPEKKFRIEVSVIVAVYIRKGNVPTIA